MDHHRTSHTYSATLKSTFTFHLDGLFQTVCSQLNEETSEVEVAKAEHDAANEALSSDKVTESFLRKAEKNTAINLKIDLFTIETDWRESTIKK